MTTRVLPAIVCLAVFAVATMPDAAAAAQAPRGRAVVVEFLKRVDNYAALRREVAKSAPPMTIPTDDVAEILSTRARFVEGLRSARGEARTGDIFTPAIAAELKRLLFLELGGPQGSAALEIMSDDAPEEFALAVNATYPVGVPRGTITPGVLRRLPVLPAPLEYRFVGPHLLLLDVQADLIVDFIADAVRPDPSAPFRVKRD